MTDKTLTLATVLAGASVANDDEVWIWDVSAGQLKKTTRAELIGGAYVLVVPASGTVALLGVAQTFTKTQIINPDTTSANGEVLDMPASNTANALSVRYNGGERFLVRAQATYTDMIFSDIDAGAAQGPYIQMGRNSNASTPAAGFLRLSDKGGSIYRIWPDDTGVMRVHTADPTNAYDTAGTVIGTQTSNLDAKIVVGQPIGIDDVLAAIQLGAAAVRRFVYKNGEFNGEEFSGLVTDFAPRYGMDRDDAHPAGKSLNVITVLGDLMMAVANLTERVRALEGAS